MASNLYTTPLDLLRQMIANTTAFQSWTGAASALDAFTNYTIRAVQTFPIAKTKLAIIGNDDDALAGERDAQGGGVQAFKQSVGLILTLLFDTEENPESEGWYTALETFTETAGDILSGILAECGKENLLLFSSYFASRAYRSERSEDKYLYVTFTFTTGT